MRKLTAVMVLLAILLAACQTPQGATPLPTAPPLPPATAASTAIEPAETSLPATAVPTQPAPPTAAATQAPPPKPSVQPTVATQPPLTQSLWPAYVRSLDFRIPAGNTYNPRAMALDPTLSRLYTRTHAQGIGAAGWVAALDPATGQVLRTAQTGPDEYSQGGLVADTIRQRVIAVNPGDKTATILDGLSLAPIKTLEGVECVALDAEGGLLYTAGPGNVRALDAVTYAVVRETTRTAGIPALALAVDPIVGRLYMVIRGPISYILAMFDTATLGVYSLPRLPGPVSALLADPKAGRVYYTGNDGTHALLWILDLEGKRIQEVPLGDWTQDAPLALDESGGRLFVGRTGYGDYGISVYQPSNGQQVADIPLQFAPNALLWDGSNQRLWVSQTYQDRLSVVDMRSGRVLDHYPTATGLADLALDAGRGQVYVADTADKLHVLDSDGDALLAVLPGAGQIAVDAPHGRFYSGSWNADRVRIYNSDRLVETGSIQSRGIPVADAHSGGLYVVNEGIYLTSLETLTITGVISDTLPQSPGFSASPTAVDAVVDPGTGRIFAIISNGVPGSNGGSYLYVYEPVTYEKVLADTERSPSFVDVDPATGRAYVSRVHLAGRSTSVLAGGRTYTARVESLYGALRMDPGLGRVYLSVQGETEGQLFVLDATTLAILGSVPIPARFSLRALDAQRHWLYLGNDDGLVQIWSATGGALPAPQEPVPADLATAGPGRLFLPPGDAPLFAADQSRRLYRSGAGGGWGRLGGGLPDAWVNDLGFSPGYAQDQTLWAGVSTGDQGYGVWQSTDGGMSWRSAGSGLTDLSSFDLVVSPAFARDKTLFVTAQRSGLYRSVDGGQSWVRLTGRYQPPETYPEPMRQVLLSPGYGQDRTLFISHYGQWRSDDGGDSWKKLDLGLEGYGWEFFFLSPDYATSRGAYALLVLSDSPSTGWVVGSVDGGDTWTRAGDGPPLDGYGEGRMIPAPAGLVYLIWSVYDPDAGPQVYRSGDVRPAGGKPAAIRWERMAGASLRAATPIELSGDGKAFVALDAAGKLLRWPVSGLKWEPVAAPSPPAPPTAPPKSTATPTPVVCKLQPDRFRAVWEAVRDRLGCPQGPSEAAQLAEQRFEHGLMIWEQSTAQIYVLLESGTWKAYKDTFLDGVDPAWDANLPGPPQQPQRGFGKVWRQQLGGQTAAIGWALEIERGVSGWRVPFERGLLLWTDSPGTAYVLYADGTWEAIPAPAP